MHITAIIIIIFEEEEKIATVIICDGENDKDDDDDDDDQSPWSGIFIVGVVILIAAIFSTVISGCLVHGARTVVFNLIFLITFMICVH